MLKYRATINFLLGKLIVIDRYSEPVFSLTYKFEHMISIPQLISPSCVLTYQNNVAAKTASYISPLNISTLAYTPNKWIYIGTQSII